MSIFNYTVPNYTTERPQYPSRRASPSKRKRWEGDGEEEETTDGNSVAVSTPDLVEGNQDPPTGASTPSIPEKRPKVDGEPEEDHEEGAVHEAEKDANQSGLRESQPILVPGLKETLLSTVNQNTHYAQLRAFEGTVVLYNLTKIRTEIGRKNENFEVDVDFSKIFENYDTVSDLHAVILFDPKQNKRVATHQLKVVFLY